MNTLIKMQDISKYYKMGETLVKVLDCVNLEVEYGDFTSIIGKSGSGKSTLMNILGCLDSPTSGKYFLNDKLVANMKDDTLSEIRNKFIGFVFQGFNLIPELTAIENVELPLIYRKIKKSERRKIAINSLIKVGLEKRMYHTPSQMSGGQQQRVAIARAIATNPSIILADEPTGNLDSSSGKDIIDILKSLNKDGKTIILVTHDELVARSAKKIIKVHDGNIINANYYLNSVNA